MTSSSSDDVTKRAQEMYGERQRPGSTAKATCDDSAIRRFGDANRCEVIGFGYSRLYAMLSAVYRKRP